MYKILSDFSCICALGDTPDEILVNATRGNQTGMRGITFANNTKRTFFGAVTAKLPDADTRCGALILGAIKRNADAFNKLKRVYDGTRIGIVIGSSNTGTQEFQNNMNKWFDNNTVPPEFNIKQLELGMPADFLRAALGISGPAYTVSTACSSSAKVFQSACNLIDNNVCDAVIVGGVDSICHLAINGFSALDAISETITQPFSKNRAGINLGEGVALFIMERGEHGIAVRGVGETSDAYHITSPDPTGAGAAESMRIALKMSNLNPDDIDYINLHGTGTTYNDAMEGAAVHTVFGIGPECASTKQLTGHALGASGAIELALCYIMIKNGVTIPHIYDGEFDTTIPEIKLCTKSEHRQLRNILSNSFAFGGSNASIIIGQV